MIKPEMLKHLRVIALVEASEQGYEAWYANLCRWYSREFNTPLPEVENMADEKVIKTYYDDTFWRLSTGGEKQVEAFDEIVDSTLIESHPETQSFEEQVEEEDDDWYTQELAKYDEKIQTPVTTKKKLEPDQNGILIDKPNLESEAQNIFVEADDPPVDDDEGF
jgi:hypothetical protein